MLVVGLTGGIGAGKSTVARLLAEHGCEIVDADAVAREIVDPGEPALDEIVERFGEAMLRPDGTLDRPALAAVVFSDQAALRDLEAITHPRIGERTQQRFEAVARREAEDGVVRIVVLDHPLLVESGQADHLPAVIVVEAPAELRVARLVDRGLTEHDARARMANQATDEQRRARATHVIDNSGEVADLAPQVDRIVDDLRRRAEVAA